MPRFIGALFVIWTIMDAAISIPTIDHDAMEKAVDVKQQTRIELVEKLHESGLPISEASLLRISTKKIVQSNDNDHTSVVTSEEEKRPEYQAPVGRNPNAYDLAVESIYLDKLRTYIQTREMEFVKRRKAFKTVTLERANKTDAILLSVARSGSTMLLNAFSFVDDAFILPEPHNMFEVRIELPSHMDKNAKILSINSLLNCSFIDTPAVHHVFWNYACRNINWIAKDDVNLALCQRGKLSPQLLHDKCRKSSLNLLKIIRMPLLVDNFGLEEAIPTGVKIFNLVRAPWEVFLSQMKAGWFDNVEMPFIAQLPASTNPFDFNMDRICRQMLLNHQVASSRPSDQYIIVKYQSLVSDFAAEVKRILTFLDIPQETVDELIPQIRRHIRDMKFADFIGLPPSQLTMNLEDAKNLAARTTSCRRVNEIFDFHNNNQKQHVQ